MKFLGLDIQTQIIHNQIQEFFKLCSTQSLQLQNPTAFLEQILLLTKSFKAALSSAKKLGLNTQSQEFSTEKIRLIWIKVLLRSGEDSLAKEQISQITDTTTLGTILLTSA